MNMDDTQQATLDQIYAGARDAGVDISGPLSRVELKSGQFSSGDRLSLTIGLDRGGRPAAHAFGPTLRLEVFKDGLEWRADTTTHGDTHVSTTGKSPFEATRNALRPLADGQGGLSLLASASATPVGPTEIPDREPGPELERFEPDVSIYSRPEHEPYSGRDLEPVERDPVQRSVPDQDAADDESGGSRRVERVGREPAFDEPELRRLDEKDTGLSRLVKIGIPLLVVILLVILGINLFDDDAPEPLEATPPAAQSEPEDVAAGEQSETQSEDNQATGEGSEANAADTEAGEDPDTGQQGETLDTDQLRGSFGGTLAVESLVDDSAFESDYLLSVLDQASVDAVFPPEARLLAEQIAAIVGEDVAFDSVGLGIILSQDQASGISQNTYGVIGDLGDGTARIDTGQNADDYSEGYSLILRPCEGFPVDCQDLVVFGVSFGGPPGTDMLMALTEAASMTQAGFVPSQDYGWIYRVEGTLTRESGTG